MNNNVVLIDFRNIERDKRRPKQKRITTQEWTNAHRLVGLGKRVEALIEQMMRIDNIEALHQLERILQPHRRLR